MNAAVQKITDSQIEKALELLKNLGCSYQVIKPDGTNMTHGTGMKKRERVNPGITKYLREYIAADAPIGQIVEIPYGEYTGEAIQSVGIYVAKGAWNCDRHGFELVRDDDASTAYICRSV